MNLIAYLRVSRVGDRGGDSFISPAVQRAKIEAAAAAGGHRVIEWITDLDESGGKIDRPGFNRALGMIDSGRADGIAVAKLDRFARTLKGALDCIERIERAGAVLVSASDTIDTSTPNGRLVLHVLLSLAEWQRGMIAADWSSARERAIERGAYIAARAPLGYDFGDGGRLVPNERAADVLAAFEARAAGATITDVAERLGVSRPAARKLLQNPAYVGKARHGSIEREDAHEAIVPRSLFEVVRVARSVGTGRANGGDGLLLSGLVRCAGCRYAMSSGKTAAGRRRYRCLNPACSERASIDAELVEANVRALYAVFVTAPAEVEAEAADELLEALRAAEAELTAFARIMRAAEPGFREGYDARAAVVAEAKLAVASVAKPELAAIDEAEPIAEQRRKLSAAIIAVFVRKGTGSVVDRCRLVWSGSSVDLPSRGARGEALPAFAF